MPPAVVRWPRGAGYLHIHDVVVNAQLVLLQHLQKRFHRLAGGEELQVGLRGRQALSCNPGALPDASSGSC